MRARLLTSVAAALCLGAFSIGVVPSSAWGADYMDSAQAALKKGDLRTAEVQLRNAVKSDPQNANARFLLAEVELQLANPVAAEQQARDAEARGYDKSKTTPLIGQALLQQGRSADLLKEFQPTGKNPKLDAEIMVDRGAAQLVQGQQDNARQSFDKAQQLDPNSLQAWLAGARLSLMKGDIKAAQTQVDRALALDSKSPDARIMHAQLLLQSKDVTGALNVLNTAIKDTPPALAARLLRANILISQGKFPDAKQDVDAVLAAQPSNVEALYFQAVLLHEAKDDKAANDALTRLQPVFDRLPRAYYLQALVRENLGLHELAATSAASYVGRVPDDPNGVKLLARIDMELGRPDQAAQVLQRLADSGHADLEFLVLLARADLTSGRPQPAQDALKKAIAMAPQNPALKAQLAGVMLDTGQPDAAIQLLQTAFDQDPKQPQMGEALFLAALKTGDVNRATDAFNKVHAAQGDTPTVRNMAGLLQMAQLNLAGAAATFQDIIKSNPDFLPAQINLARTLSGEGDLAGSEKILSAMLAKSPAGQPALGMMLDELSASGKPDDAVALLEKADAAAPDNAQLTIGLGQLYLRTGKPQKALDLTNVPAGATLPDELLGLRAGAQLALKQTDEARATLNQIVQAQPRNVAARRQLAAMLVQNKDYEGARNLITAGIAALPDVYQLKLDYCLIDLKQNGLTSAQATADNFVSQNRADPTLLALRGDLLLAAGKPKDAAAVFQDVLKSHPAGMFVLRTAAAMQQAGDTSGAVKVLQNWVSAHPDDLNVLDTLASLQIAQSDFPAAQANLKAVLAKAPYNGPTMNNLAWVDQKLGDPNAAALAQKAYLLTPSPETADTYGWILTSSGDPAKGVVLLRQAGGANTNDPRIMYHYAVALKDTGDNTQALELLRKVAAANGNFPEKQDAQKLVTDLSKGS